MIPKGRFWDAMATVIGGRRGVKALVTAAAIMMLSWGAAAQVSPQKQQGSGDQNSQSDKDAGSYSSSKHAPPPADEAPAGVANDNFDPFHANQDVEVGTYYLHKGDPDAAIGRFEDAIKLNPKFAKPRLLLAEVYVKKGNKREAVKYYKEYLQVFPDAPDAKKVQEKIEKLGK